MSDVLVAIGAGRTRATTIEQALRGAILEGRLVPGTRLPSSRALAEELGCARATVVAAYEQLVAEGYLHATVGSGTTVAGVASMQSIDDDRAPHELFTDLLPGEPDPSSFPRRVWAAAVRRIMHDSPDALFRYGDRRGLLELRVALAAYLARSRSAVVDPSRVVIFGGFASALSVLSATFHSLGITSIAVEDPSLPPYVRVIAAAGPKTVGVPVDDEGIGVEDLRDERVAVCTPAHQFPMGVVLSPERRAALLAWARERDGWVVEDDYDGEFRYDRRPIGAMQGLDPDRVIYGGTASKALAPGLGIAWLVLPHSLLEPVLETKRLRRDAVSSIEQAALADVIASGRLDRHVRAQRRRYRQRRDAVLRTLADAAPWLEVTGVSAGLHLTALLDGRDEREVQEVAARQGVALFGLADHRIERESRPGLVIGYSRSPTHSFPHALERLASALGAC